MLTQFYVIFSHHRDGIFQIGGIFVDSARLNEEELTELMRLAEPDTEGNVAVLRFR